MSIAPDATPIGGASQASRRGAGAGRRGAASATDAEAMRHSPSSPDSSTASARANCPAAR